MLERNDFKHYFASCLILSLHSEHPSPSYNIRHLNVAIPSVMVSFPASDYDIFAMLDNIAFADWLYLADKPFPHFYFAMHYAHSPS